MIVNTGRNDAEVEYLLDTINHVVVAGSKLDLLVLRVRTGASADWWSESPTVRLPGMHVEPAALLGRQDLAHPIQHHHSRSVPACMRGLNAHDQRRCFLIISSGVVEQCVQLPIESVQFLSLRSTCSQGGLEDIVNFLHLFRGEVQLHLYVMRKPPFVRR